ncbi:MAG TPA: IS481 family transposase [Acidimicrobiales bacterium]|nr:IS481 family transposase [Acidimicrobiales bacterium]
MLVELRLVEQRYQAVLEVLEGATVVDVARRFGVARQTVHGWLVRYAVDGLAGLADKSSRPLSCPHQMLPVVEARIVELRREHPGWGPRTMLYWLERDGVAPLPGRTSVERCLIRHGLVSRQARKRRREDYRRWERSRSMELWQMDIVGGVRLADASEAKIVSGIDDHSRFVVSAQVTARATARPVCDALELALARYGLPEQILTDNGKVFTARFGPGPGPVLFDRICTNNGITHILTKPHSPTTTGKVERWHKTLRAEFLNGKVFDSIEDAQAALDAWVDEYNHHRPHQAIGRVPPFERFRLAAIKPGPVEVNEAHTTSQLAEPLTTRRVNTAGTISFATASYKAGRWLAGQTVEVVCERGLVQLLHRGVLIATHARRHPVDKQLAGMARGRRLPPSPRSVTAASVTRKVDRSGNVCFAATSYRVGSKYRRRQVQVAVVGDTLEISVGNELIRSHKIRHDRTREHGALANPGGRPHRINAA